MEEVREQLEQLLDLVTSPGWKVLLESMEMESEGIKDRVVAGLSQEDYHFDRGQYTVLSRMMGLEESVRQGLEEVEEAERLGEDEDADL